MPKCNNILVNNLLIGLPLAPEYLQLQANLKGYNID